MGKNVRFEKRKNAFNKACVKHVGYFIAVDDGNDS